MSFRLTKDEQQLIDRCASDLLSIAERLQSEFDDKSEGWQEREGDAVIEMIEAFTDASSALDDLPREPQR